MADWTDIGEGSPRHGRPGRRTGTAVPLLVLVLLGCTDPDPTPDQIPDQARGHSPLPMALHGMPLVSMTMGDDADVVLARLHGGETATLESYVGRYAGAGAEATLYRSRVPSGAAADSLVRRMADSIGPGTREFAHHTRFPVGEVVVHAALGPSQKHFFWARKRSVSWLAIDHGMWLYQIARNVARNRLAWRRRHPIDRVSELDEDLADEGASPATDAERSEILRLLASAIDGLPERRRIAFRLVDVEGYPATEVARIMGLSPGAVRAHVHHARRDLRARLAPVLNDGDGHDDQR